MKLVYISPTVIHVKVHSTLGREMVHLFFLFLNTSNNFNSSIETINITIKTRYFEVRILIAPLTVEVSTLQTFRVFTKY